MKILLSYRSFILLMFASMIGVACEKIKDEDFNPQRYFSPGRINATSGELTAHLTWDPSLFLESPAGYEVEIALNNSFDPIYKTFTTDSSGIVFTTDDISIKTSYYARVRAKANGSIAASNWVASSSFGITGEQLFNTIIDTDIKDTKVTLRFRPNQELTHIRIINSANQEFDDYPLAEEDLAAGNVLITGLNAVTNYNAILYNNTLERGATSFTTKELSLYTYELTPEDDLADVIANAASGEVIGLAPGTYELGTTAIVFMRKHLVIASMSGDPTDTKLVYKEFSLRGDGAGITLRGITVDQLNEGGSYVVNLLGETTAAGAATFTSITFENVIFQNIGRAIVRGSQAAVSDHKIDFIKFENVWVKASNNDYALLEIQKLAVNNIYITKSTFNGFNHNLIRYDTNMNGFVPNVFIDQVTINNFGTNARRVFLELNTPINVTIQNTIIANTPRNNAAIHGDLYRFGTGQHIFTNVYGYNLVGATPEGGGTPNPLNTPGQTLTPAPIDWTHATTDFTLPANSPLRTASTTGGPVGDPRWAL